MMEATTMEEVWQQDERSGTVAEPAVVNAAPLPPEEVQTMTMGTAGEVLWTNFPLKQSSGIFRNEPQIALNFIYYNLKKI